MTQHTHFYSRNEGICKYLAGMSGIRHSIKALGKLWAWVKGSADLMSTEQREWLSRRVISADCFDLKRVNHFWMIPKPCVLLFNFDIICMDFQSFALALIYVAAKEIIMLALHDPELFIKVCKPNKHTLYFHLASVLFLLCSRIILNLSTSFGLLVSFSKILNPVFTSCVMWETIKHAGRGQKCILTVLEHGNIYNIFTTISLVLHHYI